MARPAVIAARSPQTLPSSLKGVARPGKGPVPVPEIKGQYPRALFSQVLRLNENEVLTLERETPEECERLGLMLDAAHRKEGRSKYGVDVRVGIDGATLRLWKDAWDESTGGPTGEEE